MNEVKDFVLFGFFLGFVSCKGISNFLDNFVYELVNIVEPTGKIAPKVPGQKYDGGKIFVYPQNKTAVMTCEIVGFPVPFYR